MKECQLCKKCYADDVSTCPTDGMPTMHTISGEPVLEGKYHLEKRLGQGGMGVVYKARHAYLKTSHAIKVILPDLVGNDPQLVTRFRQEALAAAAIRHQNVVSVTDYGVAMGTMPFLVMEYVEGESLHDLLAREQRLSPQKALELMSAICAGVGAAHHQGIVHRDLKPLNIMICSDKKTMSEAVKILDFGLAKIKSGELLGSFIQAQTTGLMGSPYYMAPEQWADEEPDARSDVYSLGVMLFQMIAGDVPFKGSSIPAIMKKHLSDAPPTLAELGVPVAPQIEYAVRHAIEKDRHKRTQTVEQLVEELRHAVGTAAQGAAQIGYASNSSLPVSQLRILTHPPQAKVFVDNVAVGQSQHDGWLLLEGVQSGNHRIRISHEGFRDWESDVVFDGKPQQVVAQLAEAGANAQRPMETHPTVMQQSQPVPTQYSVPPINTPAHQQMHQTAPHQQGWQTGHQPFVASQPPAKKGISPLLLGLVGVVGLLVAGAAGLFGAYQMGVFGGRPPGPNVNGTTNANTNANVQTPPVKAEMVQIPGGRFTLGRNGGEILEQPENQAEVKDFWMDKTEVTNAEYYEFVKATNYNPIPLNWENGRPLTNDMLMPVRYVNITDVNAFIEWRSKRDNTAYRLPTEEEWEYAARNGGDNNLYPWGDSWEEGRAQAQRDLSIAAVGSKPNGANKWGVLDLVGNVYEWTATPAGAYKGAPPGLLPQIQAKLGSEGVVVRGAYESGKIAATANSTNRSFNKKNDRDKMVGFRLVRSN